jgi:hypothetical protein
MKCICEKQIRSVDLKERRVAMTRQGETRQPHTMMTLTLEDAEGVLAEDNTPDIEENLPTMQCQPGNCSLLIKMSPMNSCPHCIVGKLSAHLDVRGVVLCKHLLKTG